MYKFLCGLLLAVCLAVATPASVQACDGDECSHHPYATTDTGSHAFEIVYASVSDGTITVVIDMGVTRIYTDDHVFGYNEYLDYLFNSGELVVEIHTIITESSDASSFLSRGGCTFGNHSGPWTLISSRTFTTHGPREHPSNCMRTSILTQRCGADRCNTIITEEHSWVIFCTNPNAP